MKKFFTIFVLLSLIGLSNVFGQVNIDSGLVAKYYFNGNANDESGNSNNGTVNGATLTTDRFGNANSAYSFDGINDYISLPAFNNNPSVNDFTVSLWAKMISHNINFWLGQGRSYLIDMRGDGAASENSFCMTIDTMQGINSEIHHYIDWPTGGCTEFAIPIASPISHWVHLVYKRQGSTLYAYINNQLLTTSYTDPGCGVSPKTDPLSLLNGGRIGNYNTSNDPYYWFNGSIDDIRIYNRALTDADITSLYNENNCSNMPTVSISGLNSTYSIGSSPATLTGTPSGGTFYGVGITGNTFNPSIAGTGNHTIVYVYNNGNGCTKAICESVDITTKVAEINNDNNSFNIYPNPTNTSLTIETKNREANAIEIFDNTGGIVFKDKFKSSINISKLSGGVYFLKISDKKGNILKTEKIIKE